MNRLGEKIAGLIRAAGPISVADYMAICLFDPDDGYYTTREPFGAKGDFVTAPEVSQMFGELVAVWLVEAWRAGGKPLPVTLAEIGPGRGTLMKDMVRTIGKIAPELATDASFALVEASPQTHHRPAGDLAGQRTGLRLACHARHSAGRAALHRRQRNLRRPALPSIRETRRQMA